MRDLDLLQQYLFKARQMYLQLSHKVLLTGGPVEIARQHAHSAEFCDDMRNVVKVLIADPGEFIKQYLERGTSE